MFEQEPPSGMPQVENKAPKPVTALPKNIQAYVICGIAALMIGVIALTPSSPRGKTSTSAPVADTPPPQIRQLNEAIRVQQEQLRLEEARLKQSKQTLPTSPAAAPSGTAGSASLYPPPSTAHVPQELPTAEDELARDRKRRDYQSLFASVVALSLRANETEGVSRTTAQRLAAATRTAVPPEVEPGPVLPPSTAELKTEPKDESLRQAEGKMYRLFEGKVLEAVLTNRLDSSFSGPVNCMLTTAVYSHDGQHLLIPQGSRVLGEVRALETFGQQRLAVFFHRIIMPDGYSLSLDRFQGLNQIGETGLRDKVNHHYLQVFGVSLAIGMIAGTSQANTRYYSGDVSATDVYRQGVANSLSQSALRILDRYLSVLPTFTIREGHRIKVYFANDLLVPAYEKHTMPADL